MRAAGKRVVDRNHIARIHLDFTKRRGHGHGHRAKMHRHVVALGDDSAV